MKRCRIGVAFLFYFVLLLNVVVARDIIRPFVTGDIWRGYLSSCMVPPRGPTERAVVHVVDFQVVDVHRNGSTKFLFTEHTMKHQYYMEATYDSSNYHVLLEFKGEWVHKDEDFWSPCNAEGYISLDLTTITGVVDCPGWPKDGCMNGAGEFILRHDRTQFTVSGAGAPEVNGVYYNILPGETVVQAETYHGTPLFHQVRCERQGPTCGQYVMLQEVIKGHRFWWIKRTNGTEEENPLYSAWSEEVTPPMNGWRARETENLPVPIVTPLVSSMYELETYVDDSGLDVSDQQKFLYFGISSVVVVGWGVVFLCRRKLRKILPV